MGALRVLLLLAIAWVTACSSADDYSNTPRSIGITPMHAGYSGTSQNEVEHARDVVLSVCRQACEKAQPDVGRPPHPCLPEDRVLTKAEMMECLLHFPKVEKWPAGTIGERECCEHDCECRAGLKESCDRDAARCVDARKVPH